MKVIDCVSKKRLQERFEEFQTLEINDQSIESVIKEKQQAVFIPNMSKIYGVSYGIFEDVVAFHDKKIELQSKFSVMDFDFQQMPLPLHLINSTYLSESCMYLKIENLRLKRVYCLCQTKLVKKIFAITFWLFIILLQNKKEYNLKSKKHLEDLLKKKQFNLLLKLKPPKEDLLELLPFLITKATLLVIEEKITEKITMLLSNDSQEYHAIFLSRFTFQQLSGQLLQEAAIQKLVAKFLEVEFERETNAKVINKAEKDVQYFREKLNYLGSDSPQPQMVDDDKMTQFDNLSVYSHSASKSKLLRKNQSQGKLIKYKQKLSNGPNHRIESSNMLYGQNQSSEYQQQYQISARHKEDLQLSMEKIFRRSTFNNKSQSHTPIILQPNVKDIENDKSQSKSKDKNRSTFHTKFNVFKISSNLQDVYDEKRINSPLKNQLNYKHSIDRNDQDKCPKFYLKFANYLIDKKQEDRRDIKGFLRKMDKSSDEEPDTTKTRGQQLYQQNRNDFIISAQDQKEQESKDHYQEDLNEEKLFRIEKLKEFIGRCKTSEKLKRDITPTNRNQSQNDKVRNVSAIKESQSQKNLLKRQITINSMKMPRGSVISNNKSAYFNQHTFLPEKNQKLKAQNQGTVQENNETTNEEDSEVDLTHLRKDMQIVKKQLKKLESRYSVVQPINRNYLQALQDKSRQSLQNFTQITPSYEYNQRPFTSLYNINVKRTHQEVLTSQNSARVSVAIQKAYKFGNQKMINDMNQSHSMIFKKSHQKLHC
ncbi:UNKNOWN [Stylonychia lemnae]|uniref:Uncharacterized protein n=1 Tax=Stylonychia lemnae TaxID=5949 RepID=A0A078AI68_STYLE|nr:UNKNOWN [Stylonychia lemnae]|eukprot:CDW81955.1 UNKNOWN [Stylonychia lemnae]